MVLPSPAGFRVITASLGIKDALPDAVVVASRVPATSIAMFTKSRFPGHSVDISRESLDGRDAQGLVVLARNANVATGAEGRRNALEVRQLAADICGLPAEAVLAASTGVVGRQYPMEEVRRGLTALRLPGADATHEDFAAAAAATMTTDSHPKISVARAGDATVLGIAKGVGMMEPDMATLLTFVFTDAQVRRAELDATFRAAVAVSFNAVSVDTDTSTSDTAAVFANGLAGPVDLSALSAALHDVTLDLARMVARDGEGATKLLVVRCTGARDDEQAKRVGKSVVNSPLVKTAVHGADPNWGRVAMAVGKCSADTDIDPAHVSISFGDRCLYRGGPLADEGADLDVLAEYLRGDEVVITVDLGIASGNFTVYGCDLSADYVRFNADYTT